MGDINYYNSSPKLLRRLLIGLCGIALSIFVLLFAFPYLVPHSVEKTVIEKALSYVLGRPAKIMGSASFQILPSIHITATKVVVSGATLQGPVDRSALMDIEALDLELGSLALLADEIEIIRLHIQAPQIRLIRDTNGTENWNPAIPFGGSVKKPDLDWGWWKDMQIGDVHLTNGRVLYSDDLRGRQIEGKNLNLKAFISSATGAGKGISITGSADVNGEPVQTQIDIGAVEKLLTGGRLPIVATLSSAFGSMSYQGAIAKRQYLVSDGRFTIEAPDISRLEIWLGPVFDGPVNGGLKITGRLNENGSRLAINDLSITAGQNQLDGRVLIAVGSKGRRIDGDFTTPFLELAPFLSYVSPNGWFRPLQGTLKLNWARVAYGGVTSGTGEIVISLVKEPRRVDLTIPRVELFGGTGRADVRIGMGEGMTSFNAKLELNRIQTETLLTNHGGQTKIAGQGDLRLNLFSVGGTAAELLGALRGNGEFNVLAGQLHNEVLAEYLLKGSPGYLDFTQLIGSFAVNQGIIEGSDLLLKAPSLSLVGDGIIDLAQGFVDVRLQSLTARKSVEDDESFHVQPFRISGTLGELEIQPDD